MANLDISAKLGHEKQELTIAKGKTYEVDCGAFTMLKVQECFKSGDFIKAVELLLGKKAVTDMERMRITLKELKKVIIAAAAQVNEISYDEMEARFRE